jgi:hypothetical protein
LYVLVQKAEENIAELQKSYVRFPENLSSNLNVLNKDTRITPLGWPMSVIIPNTTNLLKANHFESTKKLVLVPLNKQVQYSILDSVMELGTDKTIKTPSIDKVSSLFYRISYVLTYVNSQVDKMMDIMQTLREGKLPPSLYNQLDLTMAIIQLKRMYPVTLIDNAQDLIARLELQELTFTVRSSACEDICLLDILTIVPLITVDDKYTMKEIKTLPSVRETYMGRLKWTQVQPDKFFVLSSLKATIKLNEEDDLQCIVPQQETRDSCKLCFVKELEHTNLNECEQSLVKYNAEVNHNCTIEEIEDPQDQIVRIKENQWAYLDATPGTLTEECPARPQYTFDLPHTGTITFNPSCAYSMVNGPFGLIPIVAQGIKFIATQGAKRISSNRNFDADLTKLENHFQKFGYIYLLTFAGFISVICACLSYFCCLRIRQVRILNARARQRVRYTAAARNDSSENQPAATIQLQLEEAPARQTKRPFFRLTPGGIGVNEIV